MGSCADAAAVGGDTERPCGTLAGPGIVTFGEGTPGKDYTRGVTRQQQATDAVCPRRGGLDRKCSHFEVEWVGEESRGCAKHFRRAVQIPTTCLSAFHRPCVTI